MKLIVILLLSLVTITTTIFPGGFHDLDVDDSVTKSVAKFAVREIGKDYKLVQIISGMKQVCASTVVVCCSKDFWLGFKLK